MKKNITRTVALVFLVSIFFSLSSVCESEENIRQYIKVGAYVYFGYYEQDGNKNNGKEPIEWIVLASEGKTNRVLLFSRYALDAKAYNNELVGVSWESCTLRKWLNNEFYNTAFGKSEKEMILATEIESANDAMISRTRKYVTTKDKVFLLSYDEVERYMPSMESPWLIGGATDYCAMQMVKNSNAQYNLNETYDETKHGPEYRTYWWLRTYDDVGIGGIAYAPVPGFSTLGSVTMSDHTVRPAIWIDMSCEGFSISVMEDGKVCLSASGRKLVRPFGGANVRSGPGTEYEKVGYASSGETYVLLGEDTSLEGAKWYKIRIDDDEGYVSASMVEVIE